MKKVTKALSLLLVLMMVVSMLAACGDKKKGSDAEVNATDDGKVLNIYCWNDEFKTRVENLYPDYKVDAKDNTKGTIGDIKVQWNITPSENLAYQDALDAQLLKQADASADEKIDIFLIEADYAPKYVDANVSLAIKDLGIDIEKDLANQYGYTQDVVTDKDGNLKGVSWQGCPGALIYRTDIAEKVLGSSDPAKVQEAVKDWATFDSTAATMKDAGYTMLAGLDDAYRVYSNNATSAWVDADGNVSIDARIWDWVKQTKSYMENGYTVGYSLWSDEWKLGFAEEGTAFCYFGPAWFIDFSMTGTAADKGLWHVTEGPEGFYWGGTWVCAAAGTDNSTLVKDIILKMTADTDTLVKLSQKYSDFVNDKPAMETMAADTKVSNKVLGGQNMYGLLASGAETIEIKYMTAYDQGCNEKFQAAMKEYFLGNASLGDALDAFKTSIKTLYPDLNLDNVKEQ